MIDSIVKKVKINAATMYSQNTTAPKMLLCSTMLKVDVGAKLVALIPR